MVRASQLYLKTKTGVTGPYGATELQTMMREGLISATSAVSLDGLKWVLAGKIRGLFQSPRPHTTVAKIPPKQVLTVAETGPDLRRAIENVERSLQILRWGFKGALAAVIGSLLFGIFFIFRYTLLSVFPTAPYFILAGIAYLPAALCAAGGGHFAGNCLLRRVTHLSMLERRYLALRLPLNRCPNRWPIILRNWIYGGDWLTAPFRDERKVYVRAFVTGTAPTNIADEQRLWSELIGVSRGLSEESMEIGRSVMEMVFLEKLPEWTRDIQPGATLEELKKHLGLVGRQWAVSLLRRAILRMPGLAPVDVNGQLHEIYTELYYCPMSEGREGLLVIIQPRMDAESSLFPQQEEREKKGAEVAA